MTLPFSSRQAVRKLRDHGLDEATAEAIVEFVRADLQDIEERNRADLKAVEERNSARLEGKIKVVEAKNLAEIYKALFYFFMALLGGATIIGFIFAIARAAASG